MNKPIIEKGYINLNNLLYFILSNLKSSITYSFCVVILFSVYFFIKTPTYSSKLTFYTNYNNANQSSLLSPFLGDIASLGDTGLNFSISDYLESDNFLEHIVTNEYVINGESKSLVEYWGTNYNNYRTLNPLSFLNTINRNVMFVSNFNEDEKSLAFSKDVLRGKISFSENRRSGLKTIRVTVAKYPDLSEQIANRLYLSVPICFRFCE